MSAQVNKAMKKNERASPAENVTVVLEAQASERLSVSL